MREDYPDSLDEELAFLETGEQFLRAPSDANWQRFYSHFKVLIGPVPYLEQVNAVRNGREGATEPVTISRFAMDDGVPFRRRFLPPLRQARIALALGGFAFILAFVLGIVIGRLRLDPEGAPGSASIRLLSNGPSASDTAQTPLPLAFAWIPISQSFQGVDMVLVPAGCWNMGRARSSVVDEPVHHYCIDQPFWIDRTEVTNAGFGSVSSPTCDNDPARLGPDRPRNCISWQEARTFCQVHGERLPTEAEWEWAARGPNALLYPWGNQFDPAKAVVVSNVSFPSHDAPVGSDPSGASWVGALDMSGNLWDWTSSIYDPARFPYPYSANDGRENDQDLTSERVLRGGSWNDSDDKATTTYRGHSKPAFQSETFGVRCIRDIAH